jgi:hypothetical protein
MWAWLASGPPAFHAVVTLNSAPLRTAFLVALSGKAGN